jgi:MFS family permease
MRYVRFAPELHSVLIRSGAFVISASALWSLLPLVAKDELGSESSGYGLLLGCLGAGSVLAAIISRRMRDLFSPDVLATSGTVVFGLASVALAYLDRFGAVAAVLVAGGMAWMTVNSTLNITAQRSLPAWVRARALAVYLFVFQGAMAVGSVIWGAVATRFGLRTTLLAAGVALLVAAAGTLRLRLNAADDVDTRPSLHWPEPNMVVEPHPEHGPVLVTVEFLIDPSHGSQFTRAMKAVRRLRRRDGAIRWGLFEDTGTPGRYIETFVVDSWAEHMRQHERITIADRALEETAYAFHLGPEPPKITHWLAARE